MSTSYRLILSLAGILLGGSALAVQPPQPPAPPAPPAAPSVQVSRSLDKGESYALVDGATDSEGVIVVDSDIHSQQVEKLKRSIKGPFLWFRDQGQAYVLQDAALLGKVRAAWQPSKRIGKEMNALGDQMDAHGKAMGEMGRKMGARSQANGSARESEQLRALGRQQQELGRKLGDASRRQALATSDTARRAAVREVERLQQQM